MEPTATVRQRDLRFAEWLLLNRWDREEVPKRRIHLHLLFASLILIVYGGLMEGYRHWRDFAYSLVASMVGPSSKPVGQVVEIAGYVLAAAFVLVTLVLSTSDMIRGMRKLRMWDRANDPDYGRAIEIEVRNARLLATPDAADPRRWVLAEVAPDRLLLYSSWRPGELHPPSLVDSFPHGKFPSDFRLVIHAWHMSILRLEPIGRLVDAVGTLNLADLTSQPQGGIQRSPRERWVLFSGNLECPSSAVPLGRESIAAVEAAFGTALPSG